MQFLKRNTVNEYSSTQIVSLLGALTGAVVMVLPEFQVFIPEQVYGAIMMVASAVVSLLRKKQTKL